MMFGQENLTKKLNCENTLAYIRDAYEKSCRSAGFRRLFDCVMRDHGKARVLIN
jgi:hypothetical protein